MNLQPALAILKKAQLSEPIHEKTDPRPGCSDHFRQRLLTDSWDHGFRNPFFAEMGQHKKSTRESLFAGIEELVNQVRFVSDVPCQQIYGKQVGKCMFLMKRTDHCL